MLRTSTSQTALSLSQANSNSHPYHDHLVLHSFRLIASIIPSHHCTVISSVRASVFYHCNLYNQTQKVASSNNHFSVAPKTSYHEILSPNARERPPPPLSLLLHPERRGAPSDSKGALLHSVNLSTRVSAEITVRSFITH